MEDMVLKLLPEVAKEYPEVCSCPKCRRDVVALALNELGSKYVTSSQGETRARVELESRQGQIDIWLALRAAFQQVAKVPHHQRD
ncbi:MAG: late competence development ComFB family protein [Firmicutes bacterium]|nr:late competence development ComFB family protein [Bacillota bacterium]